MKSKRQDEYACDTMVTTVAPLQSWRLAVGVALLALILGGSGATGVVAADTGTMAPSSTAVVALGQVDQALRTLGDVVSNVRSYITVPVIAAVLTGVLLVILEGVVRRLGLFTEDTAPQTQETTVTKNMGTIDSAESPEYSSSETASETDASATDFVSGYSSADSSGGDDASSTDFVSGYSGSDVSTADGPTPEESSADTPAGGDSVEAHSTADGPTTDHVGTDDSTGEDPLGSVSAASESTTDDSTVDGPARDQRSTDQTTTDKDSTVDDRSSRDDFSTADDHSTTDDPQRDFEPTDESTTADSGGEDPLADLFSDEAEGEDSVDGTSTTDEPVTDGPTRDDSMANDSSVEVWSGGEAAAAGDPITDGSRTADSEPDAPTTGEPNPSGYGTDQMGQALAAGNYDSAVTTAYTNIYDDLTRSLGVTVNLTHWELVEWCENNGLDRDQVEAVRTVVEAYDRAAFSEETLTRQRAESAVEQARRLDVAQR